MNRSELISALNTILDTGPAELALLNTPDASDTRLEISAAYLSVLGERLTRAAQTVVLSPVTPEIVRFRRAYIPLSDL